MKVQNLSQHYGKEVEIVERNNEKVYSCCFQPEDKGHARWCPTDKKVLYRKFNQGVPVMDIRKEDGELVLYRRSSPVGLDGWLVKVGAWEGEIPNETT